jgi:membrane-associated phospholipid phosphatase
MNTILDLGIQIILFLQGLGAGLKAPMQAFTFLGNEEFFLLATPILYWCVDTRLGLRFGLYLMLSGGLNHVIKIAFHAPRPYWYDPQVKALSAETSFGIPSGHSQHAVVVWGSLAAWLRRWWAWAAVVAIVFLIGLSRLYLGVHFPTDVLAGWLLGALLLWGMLKVEPGVENWIRGRGIGIQILGVAAISGGLLLLGLAVRAALGNWVIPEAWIANATAAAPDKPIAPLAPDSLVASTAAFFGLAAGAVISNAHGGYTPQGNWGQYAARYAIGLIGILLLWMGLKMIFPAGEEAIAQVFRFVRYALVGIWVTALAPWLFIRLKLARRAA